MPFFKKIIGSLLLLLILIFPVVNFKVFIVSPIFPAFEVVIIYYLASYYNLKEGKILIIGLFIDQFYLMPLGCNSLVFILGNVFLRFIGKWFLIKEYATNFIAFCGYALVILMLRYLIFVSQAQYPSLFEIFFQYLTTIFSYPLIRAIFNRSLVLFKLQA